MAEKYTKADYLTPLKFAKKYNIDPDDTSEMSKYFRKIEAYA